MRLDFDALSASARARLLTSVVVPRPIALVTSLDGQGRLNAAPFSYFNVMASDPPLLALGIEPRAHSAEGGSSLKDTAANILARRFFTVNLVSEAMTEAMTICAMDFPPGENEVAAAGLTPIFSTDHPVPRVLEAPAALHCVLAHEAHVEGASILIGRALSAYVRDDLWDEATGCVDAHALGAIGRMHRGGWYARTTDLFERPRLALQDWTKSQMDEHGRSGGPEVPNQ
jgi:flavin reductase (DIM6/NTAB) family NADH-FMN oxidoreductase RutF